MRVHVLFAHAEDEKPFGCSYIRLLRPLAHPLNKGVVEVTWGITPAPCDVLVVERTWGPHTTLSQVEALVKESRLKGTCLVFTLDDNLLDLETVSTDQKMYMRYLARYANGILVSTEPLARRMLRLNSQVFTLANQVDERLFLPVKRAPAGENPLTIGYMGTPTHDGDFMMVFQAIRAVLRRHAGKVRLQVVNALGNPAVRRLLDGLPAEFLEVPRQQVAYPNFVPWMCSRLRWDIAIAPLEDNYFNRFKSDLKFLDYSALGFPGVYSRMPVYENTVCHMETGYLAENTPDAWEEALEFLIAHSDARLEMARQAEDFVRAHRTLAQHALEWSTALQRLCSL